MEPDDRQGIAAFFVPDEPLAPGAVVSLGETNLHHVRVRRLGVGAKVALLDGAGHRAAGTLVRLTKTAVTVEVEAVTAFPPLPPVHLLVPIADRDRMMWLAEKCAELAATSWRPVLYRRSRSVKPRGEGATFALKVRSRMAAALEQGGGTWLPVMYPEATLTRAVSALPAGSRFALHPDGAPLVRATFVAPVTLAIGPEGGLEKDELDELEASGFLRATLSDNILRFETAGIAGLAIARSALAHP